MALSLDGSGRGGATGGTTVATTTNTLTTTGAGIIVVATHAEAVNAQGAHPTVSGVSGGSGLTFTKRASYFLDNAGTGNAYNQLEVWWAYSSGAQTAITLTATWGGVTLDDMTIIAFGVKGFTGTSYQTNPWDQNVSLPAVNHASTSTAATVSGLSTTNTDTMIFAVEGSAASGAATTGTIGGNTATNIANILNGGGTNNSITAGEYWIAAAAQSAITANFAETRSGWIIIADALAMTGGAAAAETPLKRRVRNLYFR